MDWIMPSISSFRTRERMVAGMREELIASGA